MNTGDLVKLNSGGPVMSVQEIKDGGRVKCQWMDGTSLAYGTFAIEQLEPAPKDNGARKKVNLGTIA